MKYYVLMFDRGIAGDYVAFHKALVGDPRIKRWCHYLKNSYVIGGDVTARTLSEHVRESLEAAGIRSTHLVVRADVRFRHGMLPPKAWEWFKKSAATQDPPTGT